VGGEVRRDHHCGVSWFPMFLHRLAGELHWEKLTGQGVRLKTSQLVLEDCRRFGGTEDNEIMHLSRLYVEEFTLVASNLIWDIFRLKLMSLM
jgi:hypothetical protein